MTKTKDMTHSLLIGVVAWLFALSVALSSTSADASSVGRVSVTEVEDVRDAAAIARAKARHRSENSENDDDNSSSSGCSDIDIGNVKTSVGQQAPRNVTVVIEGPVIQENNCR